jgi:NADH-quinone oxidoreductase subunit E
MLMLLASYGVASALLLGAIVAGGLGFILSWAFCTGGDGDLPLADPDAFRIRPVPPPAAPPPAAAIEVGAAQIVPPVDPLPPEPPSSSPFSGKIVRAARAPAGALPGAPVRVPTAAALRTAPGRPATARALRPPPPGPAAVRTRGRGIDAAVAKSKAPPRLATATEVLPAPRGGVADDLTRIRGIGPKLEALLNGEGIWHFDQIAGWKARDIAYIDSRIPGFHGRITRDGWVAQARELAKGGEP